MAFFGASVPRRERDRTDDIADIGAREVRSRGGAGRGAMEVAAQDIDQRLRALPDELHVAGAFRARHDVAGASRKHARKAVHVGERGKRALAGGLPGASRRRSAAGGCGPGELRRARPHMQHGADDRVERRGRGVVLVQVGASAAIERERLYVGCIDRGYEQGWNRRKNVVPVRPQRQRRLAAQPVIQHQHVEGMIPPERKGIGGAGRQRDAILEKARPGEKFRHQASVRRVVLDEQHCHRLTRGRQRFWRVRCARPLHRRRRTRLPRPSYHCALPKTTIAHTAILWRHNTLWRAAAKRSRHGFLPAPAGGPLDAGVMQVFCEERTKNLQLRTK